MNCTQEKTLFHLTGMPGFDEVTIEVLQEMAKAHPYFGPSQLLLSYKMKQAKHPEAMAQAARTALYITNPLWLRYQLHREETIAAAPQDTKIASLLSGQLAEFKKPVEANAQLEIETAVQQKLHTVDYFASQGIKIDLNALPQDRLTTQLRKFTDWLKQMKPAEAATGATTITPELEKAVIKNAENSNETGEVITETMAEVLEKQGQTEKAIQLYIKLSFINPEKSAYFAAKIQQLKGI